MVDSQPNVKIRKRNVTNRLAAYDIYWSDGRATSNSHPDYLTAVDSQTTTSEGHLWPPQTDDEKKRDIGGAFETQRTFVEGNPSNGTAKRLNVDGAYKNFSGCHWYPGDLPTLPARPSNASLDALGTTAIARVDPTKSVVDMSVFIGEILREGIPSLVGIQSWKNRSEKARSAGSEYLNVQFGWVPLVSEVRSLANAVRNAERILKQYERDAGRLVRRQYDFPTEVSTTLGGGLSYGVPFTGNSDLGGGRHVSSETRSYRKVWFSGAFMYWIPKSDETYYQLRKYVDYADKLLGLELTPETLWNLAPWSWAIDWFSNTGDILHNLSAFDSDRLVMKYGYIMCHQEVSHFRSWPGGPLVGGQSSAGWWKATSYRKIRRAATPYGFGLNLGSLTPYQWSILAALGLTKGPRLL